MHGPWLLQATVLIGALVPAHAPLQQVGELLRSAAIEAGCQRSPTDVTNKAEAAKVSIACCEGGQAHITVECTPRATGRRELPPRSGDSQ